MSIRLAGAAILVVAALYTWQSQGYSAPFGDVLGPSVFPLIVGIPAMILAASLVLVPAGRVSWPAPGRIARQAAALIILLGYASLLRPLGFPLSTCVLIAALGIALGGAVWKSALLGAIIAPALWVLFDRFLGLPLAFAGTWFS